MLANGIVGAVRAHAKVVAVNMPARRNISGRLTDRLTVTQDRFAFGNRARSDLVTARNRAGKCGIQARRRGTFGQIGQRDDEVVNRVQSDNSICHNVTPFLAAV